jgi:hypothetical protein
MPIPLTHSLSASNLIHTVFNIVQKIPDPRTLDIKNSISFSDHIMTGLAIFGLKFPSLLQYDRSKKEEPIAHNLRSLYHVANPPSDTYLRERLDELDPLFIRPIFKKIFAIFQRSKHLEKYSYLDDHYLLAIDGTGEFSSSEVCCKHCCKKKHSNGTVSYYHQMLGACIVHPDQSRVIPLCPEIIQNQDGAEKNDCERNATKRFIENFRREHPHLKVIIIEDGLASNAPHIQMLEKNKMKYILGAKPGDHKFLFETLEDSEKAKYHEFRDKDGTLHQFNFLNDTALNKSHPDLKINVLEYRQTTSKGKETTFSWVTNIHLTKDNVYQIMRGGRARWKIENETFNTLKNLGYNFEHNYGHGKEYLATILCLLMMLAFLIDQIQEIACELFQLARKATWTYRDLWMGMKMVFAYIAVESWEDFYLIIAKKKILNTS